MVGNFKKWKDDTILARKFEHNGSSVELRAKIVDREQKQIEFSWSDKSLSFAEIVELSGKVPLPPYLNRTDEPEDKERYQTVYSKQEGAVAAPTAGLHFTDNLLKKIKRKKNDIENITLNIGPGTFLPLRNDKVEDNNLHS